MPDLPKTLLITDGRADLPRLRRLLRAAIDGGIRGVQLREPALDARTLAGLCAEWRPELDAVGGLLLVNDRADIAATGLAHGVHLGHRSLRPEVVRRFLPPAALIGYSVHDRAQIAAGAAADYLLLAPLFPTGSKPGAPALGLVHAAELLAASCRPTLLLGGITASNAAAAREIGAQGVAVMGAVCNATDPLAAAAALVATETAAP